MKLFDFDKNNKLTLLPEVLYIPEFHAIYDRDVSKAKSTSYGEFCYIYYVHSYASPYSNLTNLEQRQATVIKDFIKERNWKADRVVEKAVDKYKLLIDTPTLRSLFAFRQKLDEGATFLNSLQFNEENTTLIKDTTKAMVDLKKELLTLESVMKEEEVKASNIRGGGTVNKFEK